jgi:hypothetical protein
MSLGKYHLIHISHIIPLTNLISVLNKIQALVRRQKGDRLNNTDQTVTLSVSYFHSNVLLPYGAEMVFAINVTAVCANALPLSFAPVFIEISV